MRAFRTGSPVGYAWGAAVLLGAAATAWAQARNPLLRAEDRLAMALISALTFGPIGLYGILAAAIPQVTVESDRVIVRYWYFARRCILIRRIRRITWSYQYLCLFLDRIDGRRAWVELDYLQDDGRRRLLVISYGGKWRHHEMARLVQVLAAAAGLRRSERDSTGLGAATEGEVIWER
ncbi:MAG: hypothetical protein AB7Y46_05310 [Armatimonadota bacterium]